MSRKILSFALLTALLVSVVSQARAITTVEVEVICPICGTKNKFYDYASWGSYIYHYKSKFQLVFFPQTWSATIYTCKHCHLSLFLWDFNNFPKEKSAEVKEVLKGVHLSKDEPYTDIPVWEKLSVAEKAYKVLGKDDRFWMDFYRVYGYHLDNAHKTAEAEEARRKALELTQAAMSKEDPGHRKELLLISGGMHHFLKDDSAALSDLEQAKSLEFSDAKLEKDHAKGFDGYLSSLIVEYIKGIKEGTIPKDYSEE